MGTEHPDYVKEYDKIQEQRFGQYIPSTASWKNSLSLFIFVLVAFFIMSVSSSANGIEGKWKFRDNGAVVQIYKENGLFFGRLIDAGNDTDNQKLKAHGGDVILMRNFETKGPNTYCCGTLFAPKKKLTLLPEI